MKCGNIVIIDIAILKATLPGGWTKLFDIPSGYLPLPDIKNVDMYYIGSMYVKNSDISKRIRVTNNVVYGYSDTSISVKVKSFAPRQIQRRLFAALVTLSRKVFRPWHKWF